MRCLICGVGRRTCALPLEHVVEVMRPLPLERFESAPGFVLGVSIIRGLPTVVIDAGVVLEGQRLSLAQAGARLVALRVGARHAALAVSDVAGITALSPARLAPLPGLLVEHAGSVDQLATLDGELLEVLQSARIVDRALLALPTGGAQ